MRRYLDGAAKGVLRAANIMPVPQIEIVVDPAADPEEVKKRIKEHRDKGIVVIVNGEVQP